MLAYSIWGIIVLIFSLVINALHAGLMNPSIVDELKAINERYDAVNKFRPSTWYRQFVPEFLFVMLAYLWPLTAVISIYLLACNTNVIFWIVQRALRKLEVLEKQYNISR